MPTGCNQRAQQGVTLIEALVALCLFSGGAAATLCLCHDAMHAHRQAITLGFLTMHLGEFAELVQVATPPNQHYPVHYLAHQPLPTDTGLSGWLQRLTNDLPAASVHITAAGNVGQALLAHVTWPDRTAPDGHASWTVLLAGPGVP